MRQVGLLVLTVMPAALASASAYAHSGGDVSGGFVGGFTHPLFGLDHVAAMVAVGLWGAILGQPAIVVLPVVFPLVMACGGVLAIRGVPLPGAEIGVAISAIGLGSMVALSLQPPLLIASALVGAFAIFHGHTHGAELPAGADAAAYSIGFVLATGLLHMAGISQGLLMRYRSGRVAVGATGLLIAGTGAVFLWARI
jgi:urease accessory protein